MNIRNRSRRLIRKGLGIGKGLGLAEKQERTRPVFLPLDSVTGGPCLPFKRLRLKRLRLKRVRLMRGRQGAANAAGRAMIRRQCWVRRIASGSNTV
ncbi:MAG: hypothetical protein B7X57_10985 [Erythrobacter sp. 34-65-8]|nr:MAG: hypothetical protein B7X57_10985 [Erythrobacter sp. 34-65-8]